MTRFISNYRYEIPINITSNLHLHLTEFRTTKCKYLRTNDVFVNESYNYIKLFFRWKQILVVVHNSIVRQQCPKRKLTEEKRNSRDKLLN